MNWCPTMEAQKKNMRRYSNCLLIPGLKNPLNSYFHGGLSGPWFKMNLSGSNLFTLKN
jgi:hypothetical protein